MSERRGGAERLPSIDIDTYRRNSKSNCKIQRLHVLETGQVAIMLGLLRDIQHPRKLQTNKSKRGHEDHGQQKEEASRRQHDHLMKKPRVNPIRNLVSKNISKIKQK